MDIANGGKLAPPIVVIEPNYRGHRMIYCRLLSELALSESRRMILATSSDTLVSSEYATHLQNAGANVESYNLGALSKKTNLPFQIGLLKAIRNLKQLHPESRIFVLEGDKFVVPFGLLLKSRYCRDVTVLIMRAPELRWTLGKAGLLDLLKSLGMAIAKRRGASIKVLAPALSTADAYTYRGHSAVPDPIELASTPDSIERYRQAVGLDRNRRWIGVFGNISPRKNLDLVIDAVALGEAKKYGILVAGKIEQSELARCTSSISSFRQAGGEIVFDTRLLSDTELDSAIGSVSVAAIAHSSEGPSGILGKAVASGVTVAAAGAQTLREDTERLQAGYWSPLDVDAFAKIIQMAERENSEKRQLANGRDFARALMSVEKS